jgi:hypothetical protein
MEDDRAEGNPPGSEAAAEAESRREEAKALLAAGPGSGNRAAALGFLALLVLVAAFLHYHFSGGGPDSLLGRLDSALIAHAELSVAAMEDGSRMAVVPSWPLDLYESLRLDIAMYAAFAAAAALVWSLAARARARRDAFVVHEQLRAELDELRRRLDGIEQNNPSPETTPDTKG